MEDTISILRGIKDRYELHHGVRIQDAALVQAAVLANRYLTERKMPDKAIDLLDEAASRLRLQQESKPEPIWRLERDVLRKRIEVEALKKETDAGSAQRRAKLEHEVDDANARLKVLTQAWDAEKVRLQEAKTVKERLEVAQRDLRDAERRGDFARAGELMHAVIPELRRAVEAGTRSDAGGGSSGGDGSETAQQQPQLMLGDAVTPHHIAEVISRSTGIPLENLVAGEREKLLQLETELHRQVGSVDSSVGKGGGEGGEVEGVMGEYGECARRA